MKTYAVIDTNVIVAAVLTHNPESPTRHIIEKVRSGQLIPMVNHDIMEEYLEVLSRSKFKLNKDVILDMKDLFEIRGSQFVPQVTQHLFIDPDDYIFYATYSMNDGAYLITGNLRHYPKEPRILSPVDMLNVIQLLEATAGNILSDPEYEYMSDEKRTRLQCAWEAIERCRQDAVANGTADMSMEEIDEEIRLYRQGK